MHILCLCVMTALLVLSLWFGSRCQTGISYCLCYRVCYRVMATVDVFASYCTFTCEFTHVDKTICYPKLLRFTFSSVTRKHKLPSARYKNLTQMLMSYLCSLAESHYPYAFVLKISLNCTHGAEYFSAHLWTSQRHKAWLSCRIRKRQLTISWKCLLNYFW